MKNEGKDIKKKKKDEKSYTYAWTNNFFFITWVPLPH